MRIHRIHLRHVAGVDDRELSFGDGVTVVVGANETGKSTIATALQLLLEQKDRYDNAEIRAIRPVHADADPTIELECTTGPYHLTYRKVFGRTASRRATELTIHAPSPDSLTGDAAHDRMRAILDETVDEQLWAALRVQQRHDLGQADLTASSALSTALDVAGGGSSATADDGTLLASVDEESGRLWTDTGRPRKPLVEADHEADRVRGLLETARDELAATAETTDQHDRLVLQIDDWRRSLPSLERRAKEATEAVAALRVHRDALADAERRLASAETAAVAARDASADREALVRRADALRTAATDRAVDAEHALAAAMRSDDAVAEVRCDRDEARAELDAARRALRSAEGDVRLLRLDADAARLSTRIADATALRRQRELALARLDDDAPTAAGIRRLDRLQDEERRAAAVLEADLPRLRILGPAGTTIRIGDDEEMLDGGPLDRAVDAELPVMVGDVTISVLPGSSAADLADRHADAARALRTALDEAGCRDVADARERREAAADARRELDRTEAAWAEVQKADGVDGLRAALARTEDARDELHADRLVDRVSATDLATAERTVELRRAAVEEAEATVTTTDRALDAAIERAAAAREAATRTCVESAAAADRADEVATSLARVRAAAADEALVTAVDEATSSVAEAREAVAGTARSLEELDVDAIEADADAAAARAVATRRQMQVAESTRAELSGRLAATIDRGLGEQVPQLEAALADAEGRRDALRRRADALLLLRETLHRHRDEAVARYQAPLRAEIERLGRVVFGSDFTVELDESLRIVRRTVQGRTLDVGQLSGGAQEQLAIIARLAAASLVDKVDGVPLILDDALGYADPIRTDRVNTLLSTVGRSSQVIVLTCDPDRFTGVSDAAVVAVG